MIALFPLCSSSLPAKRYVFHAFSRMPFRPAARVIGWKITRNHPPANPAGTNGALHSPDGHLRPYMPGRPLADLPVDWVFPLQIFDNARALTGAPCLFRTLDRPIRETRIRRLQRKRNPNGRNGSNGTRASAGTGWQAAIGGDSGTWPQEGGAYLLVELRIASIAHRKYAKRCSTLGFFRPVREDDSVQPA